MTREAFIDAARALKGARWRHRGRSPRAVDCIGLITLAAREARMAVEDATGYGREPWEDRLRSECQTRFGAPLAATSAQPGDVAIFRFHGGEPSHVGIIAGHPDGGLSLIHSQQFRGVVEQRLAGAMLAAIVEVYRPTWGTP